MLAAFAALLAFSTNIARGPFQGYVPDLVPEQQVGLASAMVGLMQILGNVTGFVLGRSARSPSAGSSWRSSPSRIVELRDDDRGRRPGRRGPAAQAARRASRGRRSPREAWGTDILQERSYVWLLASRLFFLMGGAILVNLILTYLKQTHGLDEEAANATNLVMLGDRRSPTSSRSSRRPGCRTGSGASRSSTRAASSGSSASRSRRIAPAIPIAHRRRRAVRRLGRDVPRGRLGADDRHHPEGRRRVGTWASRTSRPTSSTVHRGRDRRARCIDAVNVGLGSARSAGRRPARRRVLRHRGAHAATGRGAAAVRAPP